MKGFKTLEELKSSTHDEDTTLDSTRSLFWKAFLLFETLDTSQWAQTIRSSRDSYSFLRKSFFQALQNADEVDSLDDPLSQGTDVSGSHPAKPTPSDQRLRCESLSGRCSVKMRLYDRKSTKMSKGVCQRICTFDNQRLKTCCSTSCLRGPSLIQILGTAKACTSSPRLCYG